MASAWRRVANNEMAAWRVAAWHQRGAGGGIKRQIINGVKRSIKA